MHTVKITSSESNKLDGVYDNFNLFLVLLVYVYKGRNISAYFFQI